MFDEPTNEDRARWAKNALDVFAAQTFRGSTFTDNIAPTCSLPFEDTDAPSMLGDLITNLYHLAAKHGMDIERLRDGCFVTYEEERAEEQGY